MWHSNNNMANTVLRCCCKNCVDCSSHNFISFQCISFVFEVFFFFNSFIFSLSNIIHIFISFVCFIHNTHLLTNGNLRCKNKSKTSASNINFKALIFSSLFKETEETFSNLSEIQARCSAFFSNMKNELKINKIHFSNNLHKKDN